MVWIRTLVFWGVLCAAQAQAGPPRVIPWEGTFDARHHRLHLAPPTRWGLFREDDPIRLTGNGGGKVRLYDVTGKQLDATAQPLRLPPGHYFVEGDQDRTQFAVLPADYRGASFLGTEAYCVNDQGVLDKLGRIQPAWVRVMGEGYWPVVQPAPKTWHWERLDSVVQAQNDKRIIVMASERPAWVTDDELVGRYAEFVRELARRYRQKIAAIEVWNEPWFEGPAARRLPAAGPDDLVRRYLELLTAARAAIKAVAPQVAVVGPAWVSEGDYVALTRRLGALGGRELLDAFTYHDYYTYAAAPDANGLWKGRPAGDRVVSADQRAQRTREILRDDRCPIWVDEIGLYGGSALGCPSLPENRTGADWFRGMCRAIKTVVLYRSKDVAVLIPHVLALGAADVASAQELHGWELGGRGPHPKTSAFLMTCYWLEGARLLSTRQVGNVHLSAWKRADASHLVFVWVAEGQTRVWPKDAGVRITNIYGQPVHPDRLTEEPLLFHAASDTLLDRLTDLIGR